MSNRTGRTKSPLLKCWHKTGHKIPDTFTLLGYKAEYKRLKHNLEMTSTAKIVVLLS